MITRRTFVAGSLGAASLTGLKMPALAQSMTKLRFGPTTTAISTGHAAHSSLPVALGYWADEGLDVEVFGVAGPAPGLQMITSGQMEFVTITAEEILYARTNGMPVKTGYMHSRHPIGRVVTPKSANITNLADLKGKTIGSPVLQTNVYASGIFAEAGVDLNKDIDLVATGTGAPAALALRRGDILGWVSWDTAVAGVENLGIEFDYHYPSYYDMLLGNFVTGAESTIDANPEVYVKLCRGIAKAVHFGLTNPEAAIRIHWEVYPQTRPQGGGTPEEMAAAKRVFMARFDGYALQDGELYGEVRPEQWARVISEMAGAGLIDADYDISFAFDPSWLEEINAFDREEVAAQARNWAP
ncbi:ABC transporter substrate-binding protein [Acuticoccus mangrovi]|uniref:ABC transporter substrate-binding protein n=1 Tax=Acuticoccus mangrovi TaxID=2796142 RepID=A0A934IMM0_9HYPH|nr:ABC transporter substrate-binding protein [Acuticoccus mangrovi]MBJ3774189.1 ABC transporter substrate-binding protein [Acuticoccus mangrovi]